MVFISPPDNMTFADTEDYLRWLRFTLRIDSTADLARRLGVSGRTPAAWAGRGQFSAAVAALITIRLGAIVPSYLVSEKGRIASEVTK